MGRPTKQVLILSTIPEFTLGLLRTAALAGYRPHVASDRAWSRDRFSAHGQRRLVLPLESLETGTPEAIQRINAYVERHGIELVLAGDTRCTRMLAVHGGAIRGARTFPMPSLEVFDRLYNKWTFYQHLLAHGIPTPRSRLVASPEEVDGLDLGYPVMVKPRLGENGKGVRRVDDPDALRRDLEASAQDGTLPLIVQQFLPGRDIDLDLLADGGELICWLVQQREGSGMRFLQDDRVVEMGRAMCRTIGYRGVGHVDMRIDARTGGVLAIEFNPRFWGSLVFASWQGVNFLEWGASLLGPDRPRFTPQFGYCPWLGAAPGNVGRWLRSGLGAPWVSGAQRRSWSMQLRDPLPEWRDWAMQFLDSRET